MFKKTLAASALAILAVFAVAPAANAVSYVPNAPAATISASAVAGESVVVTFGEGSFAPNEDVNFTVDGATTVGLAAVKAVVSGPITKAASATGVATVTVTLPANATGSYTTTANGVTSGSSATASFTVVNADGTAVLAATGVNSPMLLIWAASGVLLLGVALVLVRNTVRRQGASA